MVGPGIGRRKSRANAPGTVATCLALLLSCLPVPLQSQLPQIAGEERRAGSRHREEGGHRERSEREAIRQRENSMREADEERARTRNEQGNYFRQREAEEHERDLQRVPERIEVEGRQKILREAREREAAERARELRELRERQIEAQREGENRERAPERKREPSSRGTRLDGDRAPTVSRSCSASPYCPMASGYGNACKEIKGGSAVRSNIVRLCQQANSPDPCGVGLPGGLQAQTSYRARFGGGCAQQCVSVASCPVSGSR